MIVGSIRATKFALNNFFRNLWLSVITVFLMILTLLSITLVFGLNIVGHQIINAIQDKVDIDLYFYDSVTEQEILDTQNFLSSMDEVSDVRYVSKEDADKLFRESHADDVEMIAALDELDEIVFPASLIVQTEKVDDYAKVISRFEASEYFHLIDEADYGDNQQIIATISQITERAYQVGIGVSTIFILISIVVIFNTIRITIYSHREEVGIMKLVGATNWFIRAPFFIESILLALIASGLTLGLFYVLLTISDPAIRTFFSGYDFSILQYFQTHWLKMVVGEVLIAIVLSVMSSMVAITRYLKV